MDVGPDPELTKWSVRSGPVIVLTGKGYKEHHWLVVPPSTSSVISTSHHHYLLLSCRCPLVPSPEPKIDTAGVVLLSRFVVRPGTAPTLGEPLLPSCSTRRDIA